jgi:alginate O-acetyltransferase complex protein AlgI
MVFSSHVFLFFFLPVVLACNTLLPFRSLSAVLTVLSYLFYGWANPVWILLMLASSYVDYFCGLGLVHFGGHSLSGADLPFLPKGEPRNRRQRLCLVTSLVSNLGILAFFKYYDFGVTNLEAAAAGLGLGPLGLPVLNVALPVGVSFYTFQSMSYAIDVYRGAARPLKNPVDFQLFVALFPQLIAGPIVRYQTVAEQIRHRTFNVDRFARGVAFFSLGLGKKTLLANPMGHVADAAFNAGSLVWYDAWYGIVAYAFQIYFDFSGYSDMAVGLGLMLGFAFMKSFDDPTWPRASPTSAAGNISLSTWLRTTSTSRSAGTGAAR